MNVYNIPPSVKGTTFKGLAVEIILNAVAKDLTLTGIVVNFYRTEAVTVPVKTIIVGTGITVTDAVNGKFEIDEFLITMLAGAHFYDVQFTDGTVIQKYELGRWLIKDSVIG